MAEIKGLSYPLRFNPLGHFERASGSEKIRANIEHIVKTAKGDRSMRPKLGSVGYRSVFKKLDRTAATWLESSITEAILRGEPRVVVDDVTVYDSGEPGMALVDVSFRIKGAGSLESLSAIEVTL